MMESLNDYGNILFYNFDDTQLLEYKIKSALKGLIAETFSANNIDDLIVVLKEKNISHIYLDMDMPNGWMEVVDIIRQYPMSAHTPITAVTKSSSITDSLRLELSAYEIYTILQIPFFAEDVRNLFLQSMARDGMYKNSLSVQTIEALIEFFNCASYSHSLESLAKIYASQIELEPQLCKDIARCAKFLSICLVNDKTMQEGRRLLDRLRVAESLRNIFAGSPQENIATAIIYAIYNVEQTKTVTPSFGLEFGKNITVFEEIERLSALMPMIIEDSSDMRLSLEKVGLIVDNSPCKSDFMEFLKKILMHELLYHGGATLFVDKKNSKLRIFPYDGHIKQRCLDIIDMKSFMQNITNVKCSVTTKDGKNCFEITISTQKPCKDESMGNTAPTSEIKSDRVTDKISALEFAETQPLSAEELHYFEEIEEDLYELLESSAYRQDKVNILKLAAAYLKRYANGLFFIPEFQNIADALLGLGHIAESESLADSSEKQLSVAIILISSIYENLKAWRERIFITKDADDIHYLDSSLIADCNQLISVLFEKNLHDKNEEDIGDIELF